MEYLRSYAPSSFRRAATPAAKPQPADTRSDVSDSTFDFDRMICAFETIQEEHLLSPRPMPATPRFLEAMGEVLKLFEMLGSAFSFVKRDIERKLSTIKQYSLHDVDNYGDLNDAVEYEVATDHLVTPVLEDMMSCSRTVFRLMWALKFTDLLLEGLGKAYDMDNDMDDGDRTLRWAVARAYDGALAEHHSWSIRKTVKTACLLLPGKEAFMERVGIDITRREEFISRLGASMTPLRLRMYAFYDKHDLLSLP